MIRLATPSGKSIDMTFDQAVSAVKLWDFLEDRIVYMDPEGHGIEIMQAEIAERDARLFDCAHSVMLDAMDGGQVWLTESEWEGAVLELVQARLAGAPMRGWTTRLRVSAYRKLGEIHISVGTLSAMFKTARIS